MSNHKPDFTSTFSMNPPISLSAPTESVQVEFALNCTSFIIIFIRIEVEFLCVSFCCSNSSSFLRVWKAMGQGRCSFGVSQKWLSAVQ